LRKKRAEELQKADLKFQRNFINQKNQVVKIINNTFKKVKSNREEEKAKRRVEELKEEEGARQQFIKLQSQLRSEMAHWDQFNTIHKMQEISGANVVSPLWTIPEKRASTSVSHAKRLSIQSQQ